MIGKSRLRKRGTRSYLATLAATWVAFSCHGCAVRAPSTPEPIDTYVLTVPAVGSFVVHVEATFENAPTARLVGPNGAGALSDVAQVRDGTAVLLKQEGDAFLAPDCRVRCTIVYSIDLEASAATCHRMDCEHRVGDAIFGRASSFMLRPEPLGDAIIRVRLRAGDSLRFMTGLRRDPAGGYILRANELSEASFTAFGSIRRATLVASGATLDVGLLGAPLSMGDPAALQWLEESAACVANLFGRFPTDATIFVVPVPGARDVVFGRVMSLAGASVVLLFGQDTPPAAVHENWVVVHELFHLGCPSFVGEGHWLEEGLATYYEPILRERAGWLTEEDLWSHFSREMPRGLRPAGEPKRLEDRDAIDSTYWGGALFAFVADVRIRVATDNRRSLDDVVRAVLSRRGDATHTATVADFLKVGDEVTGTHELTRVYQSWAVRGENVELDALWNKLGVFAGGGAPGDEKAVRLRPNAPWATVRRAIAASAVH